MCLVWVCFPLFQMLKYKGFQKNNNYKTNANIFQFSLILNQKTSSMESSNCNFLGNYNGQVYFNLAL